LVEALKHLRDALESQRVFHDKTALRCQTLDHRLHAAVIVLLGLTLAACILHLGHWLVPAPWLTFACGFFPTLGAALAAINNQAEFRRLARRAEAMRVVLEQRIQALDDLGSGLHAGSGPDGFAPRVRQAAEDAARLLVNQVLDWRVVFLDRPLELGPSSANNLTGTLTVGLHSAKCGSRSEQRFGLNQADNLIKPASDAAEF